MALGGATRSVAHLELFHLRHLLRGTCVVLLVVEDVGEQLVVVLLDLLQLDVVVPQLLALVVLHPRDEEEQDRQRDEERHHHPAEEAEHGAQCSW